MPKKKIEIPVTGGVRVRVYPLICQAVEAGVAHGYRRAHKYSDNPDEAAISSAIEAAVTSELCELFIFEDDQE